MITFLRYATLVLTISALITLYFTVLVTVPGDRSNSSNFNTKTNIKEVVAYSLVKQIEIDSEEVLCNEIVDEGSDTGRRGKFWTEVPLTNLFVFSVYYDDRLEPSRYIRILGMIKGSWDQTLYCQSTTGRNTYHITKADRKDIWIKEWDAGDENTFNPVLISCYVPENTKPHQLSLNILPCQFSATRFNIIYNNYPEEISNTTLAMAVCVKPLNFNEDISLRLIQWIEINRILGATKFEIYVYRVHKKVLKILQFYRYKYKRNFVYKNYESIEEFYNKGFKKPRQKMNVANQEISSTKDYVDNLTQFLEVRRGGNVKINIQNYNHVTVKLKDTEIRDEASTPVNDVEVFERRIWQKRRNELIAYNDCLYRNLHSSHFVIPVDIDEIIVPRQSRTWKDLLNQVFTSAPHLPEEYASFSARNAYFVMEAASEENETGTPFFFQHTKRTRFSDEGESGKSFVFTKNALTVFNHYALDGLKPGIRKTYFISRELVQMNHYKRTCLVDLLPQCVKYFSSPVRIVDTLIDKYKKEFAVNYENIKKEIYVFNTKRKI